MRNNREIIGNVVGGIRQPDVDGPPKALVRNNSFSTIANNLRYCMRNNREILGNVVGGARLPEVDGAPKAKGGRKTTKACPN